MQEVIATGCFHSALPEGQALLEAVSAAKAAGALVLDAGDFFTGSAFSVFSRGRTEERVLAALYDAVVPGNHDLGPLMDLDDPDRFPPVVCANLRPPAGFRGRWTSGLVLTGAACRVGVIGYLGRQAFEAIPLHERAGFTFRAPDAALIAKERDRLLAAGAEYVIGVSHSGFLGDVAEQQEHWPLEVVVASHCHSPWSHWAQGSRHVAKPPAAGRGLLRMRLDANGAHHVAQELTCSSMPRRAVDDLERDVADFAAWGAVVLGSLPRAVPDRREVGRMIADHARILLDADLFLLNTYTLRGGLPATVTRQDLHSCAPYDSDLVVLEERPDLDGLVNSAGTLGEDVIVSRTRDRPARIATTRYLAQRLGLRARAPVPHLTLHTTITDLLKEST
ncbi:metallophosphoesterase [Streptomyces rubiginosohelvolus]|uniref:metallophosphoesterase n=1 Tax=Streptomyces rubiginosohelvolus TaxID=67362 RepID=UPI0033BCC06E